MPGTAVLERAASAEDGRLGPREGDVGRLRIVAVRGDDRAAGVVRPDPPPRHLHPDGVSLDPTQDQRGVRAAIGQNGRVREVRRWPSR